MGQRAQKCLKMLPSLTISLGGGEDVVLDSVSRLWHKFCCVVFSLLMYFFLSVSCREFPNIITENENIIQIIPIFSKIECCFHIKIFFQLDSVTNIWTKIYVPGIIFLLFNYFSGIFGMISWNTQISGQLLANFYACTKGHCKQIWCYNSLRTCIGVNICHPKERETICYVVYGKHLV